MPTTFSVLAGFAQPNNQGLRPHQRKQNMNYTIHPTHISLIRPGDTIEVDGELFTVNADDFNKGFMGLTLRGDSYRCGTVPVSRVVIEGGQA